MTTETPAPSPALAAATTRKPREVPVHIATVTLDSNAEEASATRRFVVYGTDAQAEALLLARVATFRRAGPQDLIDAGRDGLEQLKPAGGEGGAA